MSRWTYAPPFEPGLYWIWSSREHWCDVMLVEVRRISARGGRTSLECKLFQDDDGEWQAPEDEYGAVGSADMDDERDHDYPRNYMRWWSEPAHEPPGKDE